MRLSKDRLLTTHVGSLPRPSNLVSLLREGAALEAHSDRLDVAVNQAVRAQVEAGIDIVGDGEMSKASYATYVADRLTGFSGEFARRTSAYLDDFPEFRDRLYRNGQAGMACRCCTGPVAPADAGPLAGDIARLTEATARHGVAEAFLTAASPGIVAGYHPNRFYPTHVAYLEAIAEAMRTEYETIIVSGLLLQIDCPDLAASRHTMFLHLDDAEFVQQVAAHVEILNHALRGLPADRIRLHVCWGNTESPHHRDIELRQILPEILKARPMGLLIEAANPRHAHEWAVFSEIRLPDDKVLIPGVIDTTTNFIEHPALVAERLLRFANLVGRERVIAGTDCGFDSIAGTGKVDARITWAKLRSLTEGAAVASAALWHRPGAPCPV
jgi:5-methyltetrahydropteroyltriglutamate--homocysteine methyltransferase